jgi:hypothetical protein
VMIAPVDADGVDHSAALAASVKVGATILVGGVAHTIDLVDPTKPGNAGAAWIPGTLYLLVSPATDANGNHLKGVHAEGDRVTLAIGAADGAVLTLASGKPAWQAPAGGALALDGLTDVTADPTTPAGKVLGTTATGAWGPVDAPSGLPSTAAGFRWTGSTAATLPPGTTNVERGDSIKIAHTDADGVDRSAWLHALKAGDTLTITAAGVDYPLVLADAGSIRFPDVQHQNTPGQDYFEFESPGEIPSVAIKATEFVLSAGAGPKPGDVLTLDASKAPTWQAVDHPTELPPTTAVGHAQWTKVGTAWVDDGQATPPNRAGSGLVFAVKDAAGVDHTAALKAMVGTDVTVTQGALSVTFKVDSIDDQGSSIWLQTTTAMPAFVDGPLTLTASALPPSAAPDGAVLTLAGGKPAWQAPAGGAPPEVAVSATEPTEPSVLLWVKLPGGTP